MKPSGLMHVDDIVGTDVTKLRETLAAFFYELGWSGLLAKQRGGEQTLLEHSLAVFDTLAACLPFLASDLYPKLSPSEAQALLIAAVVHDAGKADPAFQAYLRGESSTFAEHVHPDSVRKVAVRLIEVLAIDVNAFIDDIVSSAVLHDRRMRRGLGELREVARDHLSLRWRKLADAVDKADSAASGQDVTAAVRHLRLPETRILTGGHLVGFYQLRLRGTATTFLHEAAFRAFSSRGWKAVLFHAEGTVFLGTGGPSPTTQDIRSELKQLLGNLFLERADRLAGLAIGSPTGNLLRSEGFVRAENLGTVFQILTNRRDKPELKPDQVAKYRNQWDEARKTIHDLPDTPDAPSDVDIEAIRMIDSEALAFKMFKNVADRIVPVGLHSSLEQQFTTLFGVGSFERVMAQSTLMPVRDYLTVVRPWHELQASRFLPDAAPGILIRDLPPVRRGSIAAKVLCELLRDALITARERELEIPSDKIVENWVDSLLTDLVVEGLPPTQAAVAQMLDGYIAIKKKGTHALQCVHCAAFIEKGRDQEPSEALGTQTSFSNRAIAFGPKPVPPTCRACATDLRLAQLLLGGQPATVIALVPRRSLGPRGASELLEKVRSLRVTIDRQLSPATRDLNRYVALTYPASFLRAAKLSECLLRESADKRKIVKALAEALDEVIDQDEFAEIARIVAERSLESNKLATMLLGGSVPKEVRERPAITRAILSVSKERLVDFALPTPNLIVVSLDRQLAGKDDKEMDRALYSFALATLFALELDVAAVVAPVSELRSSLASRLDRTVYVPANGPVRSLLGGEWLSLENALRWLRAIQAAGAVKENANANSLYEILRYPSSGFLVRRIEQNSRDHGVWWPDIWHRVETLREVLG